MADVFLSYARKDSERAIEIREGLKALGLSVFFDSDGIDSGVSFPEMLDKHVKSAGAVVGVWSPHAFTREWVKIECAIGLERKVLLPVSIEPIPRMSFPIEFWNLQYVDLNSFTGDPNHPGWQALLRNLARTLNRPELAPPQPEGPRIVELAQKAGAAWRRASRPRRWALASLAGVAVLALAGLAVMKREAHPDAVKPLEQWINTQKLAIHLAAVNGVSFSPDGSRILTASDDHTIQIWNAANGGLVRAMEGPAPALSASFSPDGSLIAAGYDDGAARIWSAETGALMATLDGDGGTVWRAAFSPDASRVALASGKEIRRYNPRTGEPAPSLSMPGSHIVDAAWSVDGERLAVATASGDVQVWDAARGEKAFGLDGGRAGTDAHNNTVTCVTFTPDGEHIVTGSRDATVRVWDARTGKPQSVFKQPDIVWNLSISPDSRRIATAGGEGEARVLDLATGELLARLPNEGGDMNDVKFSPDGRTIATVDDRGFGWIWRRGK